MRPLNWMQHSANIDHVLETMFETNNFLWLCFSSDTKNSQHW